MPNAGVWGGRDTPNYRGSSKMLAAELVPLLQHPTYIPWWGVYLMHRVILFHPCMLHGSKYAFFARV